MKNKSFFYLTVVFFLSTPFAISTAAYAAGDSPCQPIYGGGQTCIQVGKIAINKTVQNPKTKTFVDNLTINDPKFGADQTVTFKLTVINTDNESVSNITVKDVFPQFINHVSGPGNFDPNTKTLTFTIDKLDGKKEKSYTIVGKVVPGNQLQMDQGSVCVINQATATANGQTSQDNSQFCLQKEVTPSQLPTTKGGLPVFPPPTVETTPSTGPEMLPLLALLPTGILGAYLQRKALNK